MEIYKREEVVKKTLKYFGGDELATDAWINKYCLKDSEDNLYESNPDDMHRRLASELARIEKKYKNPLTEKEIYDAIKKFKYIVPQGGPMAGIGNPYQTTSLSNCFVIGNEGASDSYGGIMKIDQEQVQLMKRRGGVGHDLSHIRPTSTAVMNSALTSTGVVPFMERYSNSTREVAQDGRRGALMLSISIQHPDAEYFIDAKTTPGKITGANVSVKLTDEFMKAVINKSAFTQQFPIGSKNPKITRKINAVKLWDKIIHNAWKSAEPGMLFWDTIMRESIPDCYADLGYKTVSLNPCGEITLCVNDSCRLLSLNLYSFVEDPFTNKARFNFEKFKICVRIAQRLMDDIIDLELEKIDAILEKVHSDPEDEEIKRIEIKLWENIRQKAYEGRRTGTGITAEGDMLAAMGLKYGSDDGIEFSVKVHQTLAIEAYRSSVEMAKERGSFTIYDPERENNNPFILRIKEADFGLYEKMVKYGRRNIALLTIAPTGTTSLMTQTTSGIEPVFLPIYKRRRKINPNDKDIKVDFIDDVGDSWEEYMVIHPKFKIWYDRNWYRIDSNWFKKDYKPDLGNCTDKERDKIFKASPYYKSTSNDIDWVAKVKMQGKIQKWVDHSISVTVNLPKDVPESVVADVFRNAWESGCKGVTVYRDGSRTGVLIGSKDNEFNYHDAAKRGEILDVDIYHKTSLKKNWIIILGLKKGKPFEIFALPDIENHIFPNSISKAKLIKVKGGVYKLVGEWSGKEYVIENVVDKMSIEVGTNTRKYSMMLRHGIHPRFIVEEIDEYSLITSFDKVIARVLKKYFQENKEGKCPECGGKLIFEEACLKCSVCDWGKCG